MSTLWFIWNNMVRNIFLHRMNDKTKIDSKGWQDLRTPWQQPCNHAQHPMIVATSFAQAGKPDPYNALWDWSAAN